VITTKELGGGKFANGAITGTFAYLLSTGMDLKKLGNDALSLGNVWANDLYTGIRGLIWDKPIAMKNGVRDVWKSNHNFVSKLAISIAKIGQHLIVPTQGPWLGPDFGKYNLFEAMQKTDGSQYLSLRASKTQNASVVHDFDNGPWRHVRWVKNTWIGQGVEPGLFGQVYRAAGSVVFPMVSVVEASVTTF